MEVSPDLYRPVETKPFNLICKIPNFSGRVLWMKNGKLFDKQRAPSISLHDGDKRIDFENVMPEDSGSYVCLSDDFSAVYPAAVDVFPYNIYGKNC